MQTSESITEIAKAMSAFQGEIKQPDKSADNPFFKSKYVPLNKVIAAFKESGPKHGLSFLQYPVNGEHSIGVETLLMHTSGEWIKFEPFFLPIDKPTAQGAGSATTYAKRYALSAALGIDSDEDDDGNQASQQDGRKNSGDHSQGNVTPIGNRSASSNKKASESQIGLIRGLWRGGKEHPLEPWIVEKYHKKIQELSSQDASTIISAIKEKQKKKTDKSTQSKNWQQKPKVEDPYNQGQPLEDPPLPDDSELPF